MDELMSRPPEVDALLIRRIREGDAEAWNELIARFEGRLLAYVESRTRHRSAAEDLVQETFIGFLDQPAELRRAVGRWKDTCSRLPPTS